MIELLFRATSRRYVIKGEEMAYNNPVVLGCIDQ